MSAIATAQPAVGNSGMGVVNAASYTVQVPSPSVLAQGSIFTIFGSGLGPAAPAEASSYPLATSLQGVSISISHGNGPPVPAYPLYVSASQINAIMPSDAPLGSDTIAVTFNGQSSTQAGFAQVVAASPGVFALNVAGSGQGIITDGENQLISYTHSAAAGEVLNLWGTGLGPIQGSDAEPPAPGDIGSPPIVYIGGVQAPATYYGRSPCCGGLDQIQFQVPPNVTGCDVPLAVQVGNVVSNFVSVAVSSSSGSCSDFNGIPIAHFANLDNQGTISTGYLGISRLVSTRVQTFVDASPPETYAVTSSTDFAYANFESYPFSTFSLTEFPLQIVNVGACAVYTLGSAAVQGPPFQVATPTVNPLPGVALDAGSTITLSGPNGSQQLTPLPSPFPGDVGNYGAALGESPGALYLTPGSAYTITGQGGKNVGPFTVDLEMPQSLTWTNQSSISNITRANGVTLTWSGADPAGYVIISGWSVGDGASGFNCTVAPSAGQFEVPPIVLLALPPTYTINDDGTQFPEAYLEIGIVTKPSAFAASGLGIAQATASYSISQSVLYQ
jgi:uncharacterized protein (TIGR03437 family)